MFKSIPSECIKPVPSLINREEKSFFENTQSFYRLVKCHVANHGKPGKLMYMINEL